MHISLASRLRRDIRKATKKRRDTAAEEMLPKMLATITMAIWSGLVIGIATAILTMVAHWRLRRVRVNLFLNSRHASQIVEQ